jgi:hypothetical protein
MIWRELVDARSSHLLAETTMRSVLTYRNESSRVESVWALAAGAPIMANASHESGLNKAICTIDI